MIRNVTVIDGAGGAARPGSAIVIEDERIVAVVGPDRPPPRAEVEYDAHGLYAIPGLWDMHVHLYHAGTSSLALFLANGVTGIRDMGGGLDELLALRSELESGDRLGPRLVLAGPMLESPEFMAGARDRGVPPRELANHLEIADPESAARIVAELAARGVDFIKGRNYESEEVFRSIAEAARQAGLRFVGHPMWSLEPMRAVRLGQSGFEHGFYPWPLSDLDPAGRQELLRTFGEADVALVPTLISWEARTVPLERLRALVEDQSGRLDSRRRYVSPSLLENWRESLEEWAAEGPQNLEAWREVLDRHAAEIGELHRAGVRILPGTDLAGPLVFPGFSLHEELRLLVEKGGLTPASALDAASRSAAEFLGLGADLGTLEEGKLADLVLLARDPTIDIGALEQVRAVVSRGKLYDRRRLDELLESAASATAVP